tara:strand:- start:1817 stop:1957 length:141 start_codon:yes stop_codon:yes gene_type:complete
MKERKKFQLDKGNFFEFMHSKQSKEMAKKHMASTKARKKNMKKKSK